jgi:tripartite-type tricarboxylate transporter receptor subunit TctC
MVARVPFALMVGPSQREIITFAQLSNEARRERARLSFASWGVGSSSHLAMEFIAANQGFEKLHVPFTGQAPGMQAVASGQVDAMVLPVGGAESLAKDGRARIVAVAAPERLDLVPNTPTLAELGVPLSTGLWLALYAPARTPEPIIRRLNRAVRDAARNEQLIAAFRQQAAVPAPSTPEELAAFQKREREQWATVVRNAKIVVE